MIDLGESTNLSADEAASALAKFSNITGTSAANYGRLGSVIVGLGNNFATTEADIVSMGTRLASAGTLAGLTEPEIMALATAMSSVGIEAEAGGTAMTETSLRNTPEFPAFPQKSFRACGKRTPWMLCSSLSQA